MKKLLAATAAMLALLAAANGASAATDAEVLDSCKPHDWLRFAAAVEANDLAAMREMMNEPELRYCPEVLSTVQVLVCAADPLACLAPSAGPDIPPPPPVVVECPTWNANCTDPLPPPGSHIGVERDRSTPTGGGGGGNGGGGSAPASSAPSTAPRS